MRTLIILYAYPFTQRDYERFAVSYLQSKFKIVILDITSWVSPVNYNKYKEMRVFVPEYVLINNRREFNKFLATLQLCSPPIVLDSFVPTFKTISVYRKFRKLNSTLIQLHLGALPGVQKSSSRMQKIFKMASRSYKIHEIIYKRIVRKLNKNIPDIAFVGGKGVENSRGVKLAKKQVPVHSFDYDRWLKINKENTASLFKSSYAVFLDEDMVSHPDYERLNLTPPATAQKYYPALNSFFNYIESTYKLKVIVAVHPRNRMMQQKNVPFNHECIYGQTAELVKHSSLVLVHQSTSQSFAVLWRKPLLFLTSNELLDSWMSPHILRHAEVVGSNVLNIDKTEEYLEHTRDLFDVNKALYAEYQANYLKMPAAEDKTIGEVLVGTLSALE